jgi:hypothetical protein
MRLDMRTNSSVGVVKMDEKGLALQATRRRASPGTRCQPHGEGDVMTIDPQARAVTFPGRFSCCLSAYYFVAYQANMEIIAMCISNILLYWALRRRYLRNGCVVI